MCSYRYYYLRRAAFYVCEDIPYAEIFTTKRNRTPRAGIYIMDTKRFTKNDGGFICANCGLEVFPLGYTSRNHCPRCLWSTHLDELPGDRASGCGGLMEPVSAEPDPRRGYVIIHRCVKCGAIRRNRSAHTAKVQPDDLSKIIALTVKKF